jgi:hypothetical protein
MLTNRASSKCVVSGVLGITLMGFVVMAIFVLNFYDWTKQKCDQGRVRKHVPTLPYGSFVIDFLFSYFEIN